MIKKSLWILVALIGISSSVFAQQKQTKKTGQQTASISSAAVEQQPQKTDTMYIIRQSQPNNYVYCQLVGTKAKAVITTKMGDLTVRIDFGQKTESKSKKSKKVKDITFDSMIEALNYMVTQGWEFVQAFGTVTGTHQELFYLMRKEISPEEKAQMEEDE